MQNMIYLFVICSFFETYGHQMNSSLGNAGLEESYQRVPSFFTSRDISDKEILPFHSLRLSKGVREAENDTDSQVSFLDRAAALSIQLRQMANTELGVTYLQDVFNSLKYISFKKDEEKELTTMVRSLDEKLKIYSSLLEEMAVIIRLSYEKYQNEKLRQQGKTNDGLMLGHGIGIESERNVKQYEYYPCCIIPDHYLIYDSHFGTKVNLDLWCDSGLEHERLMREDFIFFAPQKLTEMFSLNRQQYPNLKWQFFMSASGLHTEYPAHRSGTSVGSECGQSSRHHHIYEKTIRPNGRNIVLLFDVGHSLSPRLLLTSKALGHYIIDTLAPKDNIAMLGIADSKIFPTQTCLNTLRSASHDVKRSLRHFVDYLEIQDVATNHSLGLESALSVISKWSVSEGAAAKRQSVLIIYITRGLSSDFNEMERVLQVTANKIDDINARVYISAFGLGIPHNEPSTQTHFLDSLAKQDYGRFGIRSRKGSHHGEVIPISATLRVAPIVRNFYDVVETPNFNTKVTISDPYWDSQSMGMVVTLSKAVYEAGNVIGVLGFDFSLSYFLEEASHYSLQDNSYTFVVSLKGTTLSHPKMGRPETWSHPLLSTPVTRLESSMTFHHLAPSILMLPSGHRRSKRNSKKDREYWWHRNENFGWIFILSVPSLRPPLKILSSDIEPVPSHALFHRLDLLSPQEGKVCRHFNQMGTLDGPSLFLSAGAYQSPSTHMANSFRNPKSESSIMAYLMDGSQLLSNPGLKKGVKESASALYQISSLWQSLQMNSKLQKYIIRRYGATFQGISITHPGTLMDSSYDPKYQDWFVKAVKNAGKVVVSPPFLDPGGGGRIVAVSHTVYEGKSAALHSPEDPIQAVLASDFTMGYWHKLLVDIEPQCATSIYFKDFNETNRDSVGVRCFLMDMSGYLIAHPSFLNPTSMRHAENSPPKHITHQEPVLSMALLGKSISTRLPSEPFLQKIWCANYWQGSSERHYAFKLKVGEVIQSGDNHKQSKNEHSCLQYKLTAVPASNLIFGFINQSCSPATAFCPCSMVDKLCLNCQLMESAACECPCECPLPSEPCTLRGLSMQDAAEEWKSLTFKSSWPTPVGGSEWREAYVSCPRSVEYPRPLHYGVGMLSQLDVCVPVVCNTHTTIHSCLGVINCVWCVLESDGITPLEYPFCTQAHNCYGGIRGSPSPYPPGLSPLPHSKERGASLPVGPVAGGVMAVFVIMGLAIYFYRSYVGARSSSRNYPINAHRLQNHHTPLYPPEVYPDMETGENNTLDDGIISASAAATISPYRMNPGYRRPVPNAGESSDHGYSTMTPHDDSENLTYTDLTGSSLFPSSSANYGWPSSESESNFNLPNHYLNQSAFTSQSKLSSPKKIGPNKVIVPVTVHMVDSV